MKTPIELAREAGLFGTLNKELRNFALKNEELVLERFAALVEAQVIERLAGVGVEPVAWREFDGEGGYHLMNYEGNENHLDKWNNRNPNHKGWVDSLYPLEAIAAARAQERERICKAIKEADDRCVTEGDYMLDSDDCIAIVRGEWVQPDYIPTNIRN